MQYISSAWAISPVLAPFTGVYLVHFWTWRACFYFILFYILLCILLVTFFVNETITEKRELSISEFRFWLLAMVRSKMFCVSLLLCLLSYASLLVFLVQGPFFNSETNGVE